MRKFITTTSPLPPSFQKGKEGKRGGSRDQATPFLFVFSGCIRKRIDETSELCGDS